MLIEFCLPQTFEPSSDGFTCRTGYWTGPSWAESELAASWLQESRTLPCGLFSSSEQQRLTPKFSPFLVSKYLLGLDLGELKRLPSFSLAFPCSSVSKMDHLHFSSLGEGIDSPSLEHLREFQMRSYHKSLIKPLRGKHLKGTIFQSARMASSIFPWRERLGHHANSWASSEAQKGEVCCRGQQDRRTCQGHVTGGQGQ